MQAHEFMTKEPVTVSPDTPTPAIWLYLRFTLSYRDVEDLLAERGLDLSYETVRRWVLKFGPGIARRLRRRRPRPSDRWHLDEMVVRIAGRQMYLWRAVDHEGEVLDMLVQRRRDSRAALRLMRKLLKEHGFIPKLLMLVLTLFVAGPWILRVLIDFTRDLYAGIPAVIG